MTYVPDICPGHVSCVCVRPGIGHTARRVKDNQWWWQSSNQVLAVDGRVEVSTTAGKVKTMTESKPGPPAGGARTEVKPNGSSLLEREREVIRRLRSKRVSRNVNELHEEQMTFGQRISDRLADVVGSWAFILGFLGLVILWIVVNTVLLFSRKPWDPFPYILLNLMLSLLAGIQAPVIMMSQNRQEAKDRIRAQHDYEVNLKAELEIEELHLKMDTLRETQWRELVAMQQQQIEMLEKQIVLLRELKRDSAGPSTAGPSAAGQ